VEAKSLSSLRCIQVLLHSSNGLADKVFYIGILDLILLLLQFFQQLRVIVTLVLQESLVETALLSCFPFCSSWIVLGAFLGPGAERLSVRDLL